MNFFFLIFASLSLYAQTVTVGIQDRPCDFVQGNNNLALEFAGICKYDAANRALPPATANRVVYFGDSITQMWGNGIPGLDASDTLNRGYSGQTTSQMVLRFRYDVMNLKPKVVHIMAGTNDIAGNTGPVAMDWIKNNIRTMCALAKGLGIKIVLGSILPARAFSWRAGIFPAENIRTMNAWLKEYARVNNHVYADYHSALTEADGGMPARLAQDGVHPTADGYAIMKPIAETAIHEAAAQP